MTDHHDQSDPTHHDATPVSAGALVRAAADDELTASDQMRLDDLLASQPGLASGLDFERNLRRATSRVMGSVVAPPGLSDRVRAAIRADNELGPGLEAAAAQTRQRSFWTRRKMASAVAAVLVLALSASLILQASRVSHIPLDPGQLVYRQQLAGFLTAQHDNTCQDLAKAKAGKLSFSDPSLLEEELTQRLGRHVRVPLCDKSRAVYFAGGGPCGVPGEGPSGHLVYNAESAPEISVFIKQDNGELPLQPGRTYAMNTRECGLPGSRILTRLEDGLLYFFVFDDGPGCRKALEALGVSSPSAEY